MDINESEKQYEGYFKTGKNNAFKTLCAIYKGSSMKILLSSICFAIKHSPVWLLPIITANLINFAASSTPQDKTKIVINAVAFGVLLIINVPLNYLHVHFYSSAIRNAEAGLRLALVSKIQQLSIRYHKSTENGRLQAKLMRDVEQFQMLSEQLFVNLLMFVLTIIVTISVTLSKSLIVFGFFLISIPVAVVVTLLFRNKIRLKNKLFRSEMETAGAKMIEMVELVPVSRAHSLENWELGRMEKQINNVKKKGYSLDTFQALFGSVSWLTFQLLQLSCLVFTAFLAFKKKIPVGDVVLYQSYFSAIVGNITALITLMPIISKGMESLSSIGELLLENDVENNEGKYKMKELRGEYSFENVCFHYDDDKQNDVLKGFSLNVPAGETIALVGESGAGKSTILNLVIGFDLPVSGVLKIDGHSINDIDLRTYRSHIAVVPQNPIIFNGTIRENITYGLANVSQEEIDKVVKASLLEDLISELDGGLDARLTEHGSNLSGGQRQRISIARALIRNPQVIVLDEATSALDSVSEKKIKEALDNLTKNRTTFVVAHRLSTIQNADRIAVIKDGGCAEIGTYDELMAKKGEFYQFKKLQA
ncbi:ABC transporter ATP-binding protein [Eubacterium sp.]|uniref:ABC transporter ATP-binding protein n=1 Tax=Eubacterium sp. TaxID=142586 RepID=UPI003F12165C